MAAAGAPSQEQAAALLQRRVLYMEALSTAMRIPDTPLLPQAPPGGASESAGDPTGDSQALQASDGVFLHCMSLHKGRGMLARALKLLHTPLASAEGLPGMCCTSNGPGWSVCFCGCDPWVLIRALKLLHNPLASVDGLPGTCNTSISPVWCLQTWMKAVSCSPVPASGCRGPARHVSGVHQLAWCLHSMPGGQEPEHWS